MDSPHISQAEASDVRYSSEPPTSGPHFPFTVTPGVYEDSVPDALIVQALELGDVAVLYAPATPPDLIGSMRRFARTHPADVVMAPHPGVHKGVALTGWGCLLRMSMFDEATATLFVTQVAGRYVHGWAR
ncbi:DUF3105 domain-containing protein [Asanoa iriomotensis]